ncbi:UDP-N-acetylmuramoyl-L-alanine--D-glutamate ligase [Nocardioides sp.]|uniref:UDP-N-acetylmuramoyl-L-alanine--D-glutamate ligase n=1 Tax=Nocardioides sp. TaxID=35761 RepID=UPI002B92E79D|nr:UDP-N-acetylmuramoyl-L-alanine--D-glutamate ligase [Nocardioides sp.]HSX66408.1 UDP-N-acetylmuramoyl-L-alanine--D-glutamate ligase [Nocardioides sp.]
MRFSDLDGRKVAVWGLGLEGRAALAALTARGIDAAVAESDADADVLREAEVIVKSPGVPVSSALYASLADAGVEFTSNTDLWLSENAERAIGVTGTKGKSTTSSAIAHLFTAVGEPVSLGGNIGVSLLDAAASGTVVLEVSSYQAQSISMSPRVAVVTSLFPEHLPWHGSAEAYFADKLRLVSQGAAHVVVPGHDLALVDRVREVLPETAELHLTSSELVHADASGLHWEGVGSVPAAELPLIGVHNAHNLALAVLTVAVALDISADDPRAATLLAGVRTFTPLAHRMETVPSRDGRRWIDDSLATAPEAVIAALSVFASEPVALILGGADRGLDLAPLADYLKGRHAPVHLLLIGAAGARFGREHGVGLGHPLQEFGRMADAVAWALSVANPAGVVLLSPGAPSFDEYKDYADRARHMCELIAP